MKYTVATVQEMRYMQSMRRITVDTAKGRIYDCEWL